MPVYESEEYKEVITRIKDKVAHLNIKMGSTLSEKDIKNFEEHCSIKLPSAYRIFLKEVGDGCDSMLDGFRLNRLEEMKWEDLSHPFMLEEPWIWENDESTTEQELSEKIELLAYNGELELIDIGDSMTYHLIVSGKCRGEVWYFSDVGVQPLCERQDFFGWFEAWLDCGNQVDYFKDYVYHV